MNQRHFIRWLLKQGLTDIQVQMAAILFAVNGYESAKRFVENCQK